MLAGQANMSRNRACTWHMTFAELKPGTFIRSIMSSRQGGWPARCADDTMPTHVESQSNHFFCGEDGEADE